MTFLNKIKLDDNPIIFDVGCNNGINLDDVTQMFLETYPDCFVYGIEALHWHTYEEKYKDNPRVKLIKKALWENKGTISFFNTWEAPGISSLYYREVFKSWGDDSKIKEIKVESVTIDDLIDLYNIEKIDYLKLDIEGAELPALKGAVSTLNKDIIKYIQLEYHSSCSTADANYNFDDILKILNNFQLIARNADDYLFERKRDVN